MAPEAQVLGGTVSVLPPGLSAMEGEAAPGKEDKLLGVWLPKGSAPPTPMVSIVQSWATRNEVHVYTHDLMGSHKTES